MQAELQVPLGVIIVTSAAAGALVSSLVAFVSAHLERRARGRELLLKEAVGLAVQRNETLMRLAEATRADVNVPDAVIAAERYHGWLTTLFNTGRLPAEVRAAHERSVRGTGTE